MGLQFRLKDRFGDNGLVSAMILLPAEGAKDCFEIDTWVMSCRVFGRDLEAEAMNIAVETARRLDPGFSDGVAFVALDRLDDPELVPAAIGDAVGVSALGPDPASAYESGSR